MENKMGSRKLVVAVIATTVWMLSSSAIIILNKNLYVLGFEKPFFVTGMGQAFSSIGGLAITMAGVLPLRKVPDNRFIFFKLLPIIALAAAAKSLGNGSYLYLSVSLIQILKAFTPALTLLLGVIAGIEGLSVPLVLSLSLIAGGTASTVIYEGTSPNFHMWGFISFMISSAAEAARVVGVEVLLGKEQSFNSAEVLIFVGGPTSLILLMGSYIFEGMGPGSEGWALIASSPMPFIAAFSMSFLLNFSSFIAIQNTSSLTFKVAGCLKNICVVWYSVVAHGDHIACVHVVGYFISVSGFALYSRLKMANTVPNHRIMLLHEKQHNSGSHYMNEGKHKKI